MRAWCSNAASLPTRRCALYAVLAKVTPLSARTVLVAERVLFMEIVGTAVTGGAKMCPRGRTRRRLFRIAGWAAVWA